MKTTKKQSKTSTIKQKNIKRVKTLSLKESLTRIVKHAEKHKFAQNLYMDKGLVCPVGLFFTEDQLKHVIALENTDGLSMNGDNVLSLAEILGDENIEAVTGMTPDQAFMIQYLNDMEGPSVMLKFVTEILAGSRNMIGDVSFNITPD